MAWFSFLKRYDNVGVGTTDLGLRQFQTLPAGGSYLGPQWNIKKSMAPFSAPGLMLLNQIVMPNTLRGNGMAIPGQYALQGLASQKQDR